MKKVFRWALLSLAVCGTVVALADSDQIPPTVVVNPNSGSVSPNMEFTMAVSYKYTRKIIIVAPGTDMYERTMAFWNAYEPDFNSFDYESIIETPNTERVYEVNAFNNGYSARVYATFTSNSGDEI